MPSLTSPTYTQYDLPSFMAGTLSTIDDCQAYVESHLKRGSLTTATTPSSTQFNKEFARAKQEVLDWHPFSYARKYAYCSTTADAYRYALPADYKGGRVRIKDINNDFMLEYCDPYKFDLSWPDMSEETTDSPTIYTVKDRELWTYPPTSSGITLELEYERSGDDSTATDVSYFPEIWRFRICDRVISQLLRTEHNYNAASIYDGEWKESLKVGRRNDNKKRWSKSGNQALLWQQEYAARYNQQ